MGYLSSVQPLTRVVLVERERDGWVFHVFLFANGSSKNQPRTNEGAPPCTNDVWVTAICVCLCVAAVFVSVARLCAHVNFVC